MHQRDRSAFSHSHDFVHDFSRAEFRTRVVVVITFAMMVLEITAGVLTHSMALLADGWHMSTHAIAFIMAAVAYYFTRRHANDPQFSFGTGKIGVLGGYSSAVVLSLIALAMAAESVHRLFSPLAIHFNEAIAIAALGLCVNLVCAFLLKDDPHHHHHHGEHERHHDDDAHQHGSHRHDLNLRAAYVHVLADAFTSVLAISALTSGKFFGWSWLDPVVGIVGSGVVFSWAYTLLRDTGTVLLDVTPRSSDLPTVIRETIESDGDSIVTDLHVWQVSSGKFAAIVSIVAHEPKGCEAYRALLAEHEELVHLTIETQHCREDEEALAQAH